MKSAILGLLAHTALALTCPSTTDQRYSSTQWEVVAKNQRNYECFGELGSGNHGVWCHAKSNKNNEFCLQIADAACYFSKTHMEKTFQNVPYGA